MHMIKEVAVCKHNEELVLCVHVNFDEQVVNIGITKDIIFFLYSILEYILISACTYYLMSKSHAEYHLIMSTLSTTRLFLK